MPQLKEVKEAHAPCAAAAAKAQQDITLLHSHVQQLSQDRSQAANNIRIAEKEVCPALAQAECSRSTACHSLLSSIVLIHREIFNFSRMDCAG